MRRWEENFEKHPVYETLEQLRHWLDVDSRKPEEGFRDLGLSTFARQEDPRECLRVLDGVYPGKARSAFLLCRLGSSKESRFHPNSSMKSELSSSVDLETPKLKRKRRFGSPF